MELKIKEIRETEKELRILTEISGYCIISLISKRLSSRDIKLSDDDIINFDFVGYDYDENNHRKSNNEYIEYADNYIKKIK